jgi:hypothetical protein
MGDEALPRVWISFDLVARKGDKVVFDPNYITSVLGVEPSQQNVIGEPMHVGKGRWFFTRWRVSVGPVDTIAIDGMLNEVISRLEPAGDRLRTVCDEIGLEPTLTCAVEPKSAETPDVTFPLAVVQWAADNKVKLAVDIMLWRHDDD